jgi:hypothetical protein
MATKAIPVVAAKVSGTHTNFPVYIRPSVMTGWGSLTSAEANSIRFYSDSALTTELAREVVTADEIHVRVPSLTTTTTIYADYDGVRADYAVTDTYGRNAVWSGYQVVAHANDATSTTVVSSVDGTTGTKNSSTNVTEVDSKVGKGQNHANRDDFINWGANFGNKADLTVQGWVYRKSNQQGSWQVYRGNTSQFSFALGANAGASYRLWGVQFTNVGNGYRLTQGSIMDLNTWYMNHFVMREGSSNASLLYMNGVLDATNSGVSGTWHKSSTANCHIGRRVPSTGEGLQGEWDEFRIYDGILSADWISTEYNNQSDVATFFGTVTDVGGAPVTNNGFMLWW